MKKITNFTSVLFISLILTQCKQTSLSISENKWTQERAWELHNEN